MDLENNQNNSLAKLPLLKQGEYDTWRLKIESYIQLQYYTLWEIIEEGFKLVARTTANEDARFRVVKKHQEDYKRTLLKQMYETFNASSSESLDSIFNRLQKIVSQLTILGEIITPEDLNLKFLRSLPTEWGMHVVVWRNKSDLGSISFDDLYNNFKIVEPEVKRSVTSSSNSASQNLAFVSGHSSTNDVNTANVHVSTGSTPVSTASTNNSTACLSDATVYAYLATQPNGSQVVHEDLDQIHEDDLDEMDLKWQLALLSMKARKFYQRTGKKIIINGSDTAGYDKKKVECFNLNVEESSSKAMLAIDGTGFDWSYMADEEASTNFALMAFSDSEDMVLRKLSDALIIEDWVSDCDEDETVMLESLNVQNLRKLINLGKDVRPFWTNAMRVNHQKISNSRRNFAPTAVLTKSGLVPFSTARQSFSRITAPVSAARSFNTAVPSVNVVKPRTNAFQKSHSPLRRPFYQQTTLKNRNFNNKVNTVKGKRITSAVGEQGINVVKPTAHWAWRPKIKMINHVYKNTGSCICK
ncbi:hypothetical protein Tco_1500114 [Tanacetum coccineum]